MEKRNLLDLNETNNKYELDKLKTNDLINKFKQKNIPKDKKFDKSNLLNSKQNKFQRFIQFDKSKSNISVKFKKFD